MSGPNLLSSGALSALQQAAIAVMESPCTLSRAGLLLDPQPTMPDGSPLRCRVKQDLRFFTSSDLPPVQRIPRWIVYLPVGTPVQVNDTLIALGNRYQLVEIQEPRTIDVRVLCSAFLLGPADNSGATSFSLVTNAVISTLYGAMPKLTNVGVYLDTPSPKELAQFGGVVRYVLLAPAGSDLQVGDAVYIQSWGANVVNPQKAYHVFSADPSGALGQEVLRAVIGEKVQR